MQTMDAALAQLMVDGKVDKTEALRHARSAKYLENEVAQAEANRQKAAAAAPGKPG
jgi:Tfp pilus assembly ATPase PilU